MRAYLHAAPVPSATTLEAVLAAIQSILPTAPLIYRAVGKGLSATVRPVAEPAQWLWRRMLEDDGQVIGGVKLYSGMDDLFVSFNVRITKHSPEESPDGKQLASMSIRIPGKPEFTTRVLELVRVLGPLTRILDGEVTSADVFCAIDDRFVADRAMLEQPDVPDDGLPSHFTHVGMPRIISWVNYWSAETCQLIGVTAESPALRVFHRVLPCDGGGLALQLTEDPLDLERRPEHVAAVEAAYAALPIFNTRARFDNGKPRIRNMSESDLRVDLCTFVVGPTWIEAGIAAIEAALPTRPLKFSVDENGYLDEIAHPGAWVAERMATQQPSKLCNGDEKNLVWLDTFAFVSEREPKRFIGDIKLHMPYEPANVDALFELMRVLCPTVGTLWGHASPTLGVINTDIVLKQIREKEHGKRVFTLPWERDYARPRHLGWINYWSQEACELVGFSLEKHADLFARTERVDDHGVLLQLTSEPLQMSQSEHMARLEAAYVGLPGIMP